MIQCKQKKAFTLVEMLLVIVIIGVLAGTVVTSLSGRSQQAKITRAQADIRGSLALALDLFEQDTGRYPTNEEGLMALVRDLGVPGWQGPYLRGGLKADPWGNQYVYQLDSSQTGLYRLSSAGPDGQHGTEDDIREEDTDNLGRR
jgi:general secretion pathway protein G